MWLIFVVVDFVVVDVVWPSWALQQTVVGMDALSMGQIFTTPVAGQHQQPSIWLLPGKGY